MDHKKPFSNHTTPQQKDTMLQNSHYFNSPGSVQSRPKANLMYGPLMHPEMRPILSPTADRPKPRETSIELLNEMKGAEQLKGTLVRMLEDADTERTVGERKCAELATNIRFILAKEMEEMPHHAQVRLALLSKGMKKFRVDARVDMDGGVAIEGSWEKGYEEAIVALKDRVDEMVYGDRKEYMG
ncbi:hypothetical protein CC80DRAFT_510201 [Byssothecium circinans]|uniref:Uncharacterized protein n=1 Tax=Byssothecium circinans TaxID=147558 RepID=A0A6A5TB67_9PLEO|nr:hypothetical protein CC80DRAFT_510201 [Byssothecium circinans]